MTVEEREEGGDEGVGDAVGAGGAEKKGASTRAWARDRR